jgi:hypothetical protein
MQKYLCWKIWLSCNRVIFKQSQVNPTKVAVKARSLLASHILARGKGNFDAQYLEVDEEQWFQLFHFPIGANQAEAYALLQGLRLVLACQISYITVVGDSLVLIQSMIKTYWPTNCKIDSILYKIF